jgi:hypothetical protein
MGASGSLDDAGVSSPSVLYDGIRHCMFYAGCDGDDLNIDLAMGQEPPLLMLMPLVPEETEEETQAVPLRFELSQNFPNPFNPVTTICYQLPESSRVTLAIYDLLGQKVQVLVDGFVDAGYRSVVWDGRDGFGREVGSGVYLVRMQAKDFVEVRKMALIR